MSDQKLRDYHQNENRLHLTDSYPRQDKLFVKIKHFINLGGSILENGFGDGYLINKLSNGGYKMIGQDISKENITITKEQWENNNIDFILGDVSGKLLVKDSSLNGYVASEVLEHMTDEELSLHVEEIYRTLKPGGYVFLTFPAKENIKLNECMCPKCGELFHKRGHKQYRDKKKIQTTFKKFKILRIQLFISRVKGNNIIESLIGYLKLIGSYILNINKSYLVILKK